MDTTFLQELSPSAWTDENSALDAPFLPNWSWTGDWSFPWLPVSEAAKEDQPLDASTTQPGLPNNGLTVTDPEPAPHTEPVDVSEQLRTDTSDDVVQDTSHLSPGLGLPWLDAAIYALDADSTYMPPSSLASSGDIVPPLPLPGIDALYDTLSFESVTQPQPIAWGAFSNAIADASICSASWSTDVLSGDVSAFPADDASLGVLATLQPSNITVPQDVVNNMNPCAGIGLPAWLPPTQDHLELAIDDDPVCSVSSQDALLDALDHDHSTNATSLRDVHNDMHSCASLGIAASFPPDEYTLWPTLGADSVSTSIHSASTASGDSVNCQSMMSSSPAPYSREAANPEAQLMLTLDNAMQMDVASGLDNGTFLDGLWQRDWNLSIPLNLQEMQVDSSPMPARQDHDMVLGHSADVKMDLNAGIQEHRPVEMPDVEHQPCECQNVNDITDHPLQCTPPASSHEQLSPQAFMMKASDSGEVLQSTVSSPLTPCSTYSLSESVPSLTTCTSSEASQATSCSPIPPITLHSSPESARPIKRNSRTRRLGKEAASQVEEQTHPVDNKRKRRSLRQAARASESFQRVPGTSQRDSSVQGTEHDQPVPSKPKKRMRHQHEEGGAEENSEASVPMKKRRRKGGPLLGTVTAVNPPRTLAGSHRGWLCPYPNPSNAEEQCSQIFLNDDRPGLQRHLLSHMQYEAKHLLERRTSGPRIDKSQYAFKGMLLCHFCPKAGCKAVLPRSDSCLRHLVGKCGVLNQATIRNSTRFEKLAAKFQKLISIPLDPKASLPEELLGKKLRGAEGRSWIACSRAAEVDAIVAETGRNSEKIALQVIQTHSVWSDSWGIGTSARSTGEGLDLRWLLQVPNSRFREFKKVVVEQKWEGVKS